MRFIYSLFAILLITNVCYSQTGILDDFSNNTLQSGWEVVSGPYELSAENEALQVNAPEVGGFDNFEWNFNPIDISENPNVVITIQSDADFTLRIDLVDNQGRSTNQNPVTYDVTENANYQEITLDFSGSFANNAGENVDNTSISRAVFFFNAGGTFNGTVRLDDISIGDPIKVLPGSFVVNQVGYNLNGPKTALYKVNSGPESSLDDFEVIDEAGETVLTGQPEYNGTVAGWGDDHYWMVDFSALNTAGTYRLRMGGNTSFDFEVGDDLLYSKTIDDVIGFFNGMRFTDPGDETLSFHGDRDDVVDVSGGWWDATGDPGKHFSHLSYANYFNPQQIPMVLWTMLKSKDWTSSTDAALHDEANFGVDYLMRNLDAEGYFYLAIFDEWGNAPGSREICEWGIPGNNAGRTADYQCAMREGGGIAIAALARASMMDTDNTDYTSAEVLAAAEQAYAHLKSPGDGYDTKNLEYCNDHTENIIDDYCGLVAAVELYKATAKPEYLNDAHSRAASLMNRQQTEGWLAADQNADRPFFHAADEGFPIIALEEYASIIHDQAGKDGIVDFMENWLSFYMSISNEEESGNPFNYAKEYNRAYEDDTYGPFQTTFFVPHNNETGYWWQGENARLSSMSTAIMVAANMMDDDFVIGTDSINQFAQSQLDWILGKNPFDVCMLFGYGNNNYIDYTSGLTNIDGGICNGITAGVENPDGINWRPYDDNDWMNWRWTEQWLPHDAWYLMAISAQHRFSNPETPMPIAAFELPEVVCTGQEIELNQEPYEDYSRYIWVIDGDTTEGIDPAPVVSFDETGEKTVQLFMFRYDGVMMIEQTTTVSAPGDATIPNTNYEYCENEEGAQLEVADLPTSGEIQWFMNDEVMEGEQSSTLTATEGTYQAVVNVGSCADTSQLVNVSSTPLPEPAGMMDGEDYLCLPDPSGDYAIEQVNNADSYQWTLPADASITTNPDSNAVTVQFGEESGLVTVAGVNECGEGTVSELFVTLDICTSNNDIIQDKDIRVYPSPARNTVYFTKALHNLTIYNVLGNKVEEKSASERLNVSNYDAGIYMIHCKEGTFRFSVD